MFVKSGNLIIFILVLLLSACKNDSSNNLSGDGASSEENVNTNHLSPDTQLDRVLVNQQESRSSQVNQNLVIEARSQETQYFIDLENENIKEYVFELSEGMDNLSNESYQFNSQIIGPNATEFRIISYFNQGNHSYKVRVKYKPVDNDNQQTHTATLHINVNDGKRYNSSKKIELYGYRPLNVMLKSPSLNRREYLSFKYRHSLASNNINLFNIDYRNILSSENISSPSQDAWIDDRPGMHGQQFVFPFNVPLIQTYNPSNALFLNQLAIKTHSVDDDEIFFVIQYKPDALELYQELGSADKSNTMFNTMIKHHALFSDGTRSHQSRNIQGGLLINQSSQRQRISISPHNGTWSPAENNDEIKQNVFKNDSTYVFSEFTHIDAQGDKKIISINVLLNAYDYALFQQVAGNHLSNVDNKLEFQAKNLISPDMPNAVQEAAKAYSKVFSTYGIKQIEPDRSGFEINNGSGSHSIPDSDTRHMDTEAIFRNSDNLRNLLSALPQNLAQDNYSNLSDDLKIKLLEYARSNELMQYRNNNTPSFSELNHSPDSWKMIFAHLFSFNQDLQQALTSHIQQLPLPIIIDLFHHHHELLQYKSHDNEVLTNRKNNDILSELIAYNLETHKNYIFAPFLEETYEAYDRKIIEYHNQMKDSKKVNYMFLFSKEPYSVLLESQIPNIELQTINEIKPSWQEIVGNSNNDNLESFITIPGLRNKFYFVAEIIPTAITTYQKPSDYELYEIFSNIEYYNDLKTLLPIQKQQALDNLTNDVDAKENEMKLLLAHSSDYIEFSNKLTDLWKLHIKSLWVHKAFNTLDGCNDGKASKLESIIKNIEPDILNSINSRFYLPKLTILPKLARILQAYRSKLFENTSKQVMNNQGGGEFEIYISQFIKIHFGPFIGNYIKVEPLVYSGIVMLQEEYLMDILRGVLEKENLRDELIDIFYDHFSDRNNQDNNNLLSNAIIEKEDLEIFRYTAAAINDFYTEIVINQSYDDSEYFKDPTLCTTTSRKAKDLYRKKFAENILNELNLIYM